MKSLQLAWLGAARQQLSAGLQQIWKHICRYIYPRMGLKRGILVAGLFSAGAGLLGPVFGFEALVAWALIIAAVFLGLGAERATTDWGSVFGLPSPRDFVFWAWRPVERKRYWATLVSLLLCLLFAAAFGGTL